MIRRAVSMCPCGWGAGFEAVGTEGMWHGAQQETAAAAATSSNNVAPVAAPMSIASGPVCLCADVPPLVTALSCCMAELAYTQTDMRMPRASEAMYVCQADLVLAGPLTRCMCVRSQLQGGAHDLGIGVPPQHQRGHHGWLGAAMLAGSAPVGSASHGRVPKLLGRHVLCHLADTRQVPHSCATVRSVARGTPPLPRRRPPRCGHAACPNPSPADVTPHPHAAMADTATSMNNKANFLHNNMRHHVKDAHIEAERLYGVSSPSSVVSFSHDRAAATGTVRRWRFASASCQTTRRRRSR